MDTKARRGAVNLTSRNDASDMKSCDRSKKKFFEVSFNHIFLNPTAKICDRNVQKYNIYITSHFCKTILFFIP
jgi:hypothetical protein